jgi:small subunit ribosomal protein S23e
MGAGKPKGIRAGRKLKTSRRLQRWASKDFNKRLLGSRFKNPFMGSCMAKGLVVEKIGV